MMDDAAPSTPSDHALLHAFAAQETHPAFTQLVARHVDMVYAAARRQLAGDPHLAHDVTQAVFLLLAQRARAGRIGPRICIPGWLYTTTRYAANNARRAAAARQHHERQAALMSQHTTPSSAAANADADDTWTHLAPLLDTALARLRTPDRNAVLLKFIENKSHRDVGASLGISEEAARKRITRALDRLRQLLTRRDLALPVTTLATLLTTRATEAAPALLPTLFTSPACVIAPPASVSALAQSTHATLTWLKVKLTAACLAASLLIAATTTPLVLRALAPRVAAAANPTSPAAPPQAPVSLAANATPVPPPAAARTIAGTVVTPAGDPVPDAEVILATPDKPVDALGPNAARPRALTEADGKFSFPRPATEWQVIVRTQSGYAQFSELDLARSSLVVLQPWGRIEGTLYSAQRRPAAAGATVEFGSFPWSDDPVSLCVQTGQRVITDAAGHFTFDRVPSGDFLITQSVPAPFAPMYRNRDFVTVEPGKPTTVDLGAAGWPVTGKLAPPPASAPRLILQPHPDRSLQVRIQRSDIAAMNEPADFDRWPAPRQHEYRAQWQRTPAGRAYETGIRQQSFPIDPDGSFHIDALPPGQYTLTIECREQDPANRVFELVASTAAPVPFTVPPLPPSQTLADHPLDLPPIPLQFHSRLSVGEAARP